MIALCLGGARTVWSDYAAAAAMLAGRPHIIVACNFAGIGFAAGLDAWVTLHPDRFGGWRDQRAREGRNTDYRAFTHAAEAGDGGAEVVAMTLYGSSGLYAAQIALEVLDAAGVIICGMPMDDSGGHIHWAGPWMHRDKYQAGFISAWGACWNVRSMGGWSAGLFGRPDADWIKEHATHAG